MSKWMKTACDKRPGGVVIRCPKCHSEQPIHEGPGEYHIAPNGQVHPDFICMNRPADGRYCECSGPLWLIDF